MTRSLPVWALEVLHVVECPHAIELQEKKGKPTVTVCQSIFMGWRARRLSFLGSLSFRWWKFRITRAAAPVRANTGRMRKGRLRR